MAHVIQRAQPMLVDWMRLPVGSYRRLEKRDLRPVQLLLGADGWVQGNGLHAWCCHSLATSAAFTAKVGAWPTVQARGDERLQTTRATPKGVLCQCQTHLRKYVFDKLLLWSDHRTPIGRFAFFKNYDSWQLSRYRWSTYTIPVKAILSAVCTHCYL